MFSNLEKTADGLQAIAEKKFTQKKGRKQKRLAKSIRGILYQLVTGCSLRQIPEEYGARSTIYYWFKRLCQLNCFYIFWQNTLLQASKEGKLKMDNQSIDCSIVKAPGGGEKTAQNPFDKSKFGCKRSLAVDENGIPLGFVCGSARQHDSRLLRATLTSINPKIRSQKAETMHLDKGYDSRFAETALFNNNYKPMIARKKNRALPVEAKKRKSKHRWVVERTFSWINRFKAVSVRSVRKANHYYQLVCIVLGVITLRIL